MNSSNKVVDLAFTIRNSSALDAYLHVRDLTSHVPAVELDCTDQIMKRTLSTIAAFQKSQSQATVKCIAQAWAEAERRGPGFHWSLNLSTGTGVRGIITSTRIAITIEDFSGNYESMEPMKRFIREILQRGFTLQEDLSKPRDPLSDFLIGSS